MSEDEALKAEDDAYAWNVAHPIGTPVRYWRGVREGEGAKGETRSRAWPVSGHASVLITGCSGSVALTHVEPDRSRVQQIPRSLLAAHDDVPLDPVPPGGL